MGSFWPSTSDPQPGTSAKPRGDWVVAFLLVTTFAIRAIHLDQPIVENYVGRQIPTAMVARNLERQSGFLHPQLETGPFPNLFLVEPPIYALIVASVHQAIGFDWEICGRLVSSLGTTLGAWGLYGLVRRREGSNVGLLTLGSFAIFPVMVRYGRAFQPDPLMLGCLLFGLRLWDENEANDRRRWSVAGGLILAAGLALKITSVWVLIPFLVIVRRRSLIQKVFLVSMMLTPALAWYVYAWEEVGRPDAGGSSASAENAEIWLRSFDLSVWLRLGIWSNVGQALCFRSFTPVGFVLALVGWCERPRLDPVWQAWMVGSGLALLAMAPKWHHAYYWIMVAPVAAVGVARTLDCLANSGRWGRVSGLGLGSIFLALCIGQSASTWRTPREWNSIVEAAREIKAIVSADSLLIAPEALLYYADRRGFRLEFDPIAAQRAAREWGPTLDGSDQPLALVDFYRSRTPRPRFLADIGPTSGDLRRQAWRAAIRSRPDILIRVDRPDLIIAELL